MFGERWQNEPKQNRAHPDLQNEAKGEKRAALEISQNEAKSLMKE